MLFYPSCNLRWCRSQHKLTRWTKRQISNQAMAITFKHEIYLTVNINSLIRATTLHRSNSTKTYKCNVTVSHSLRFLAGFLCVSFSNAKRVALHSVLVGVRLYLVSLSIWMAKSNPQENFDNKIFSFRKGNAKTWLEYVIISLSLSKVSIVVFCSEQGKWWQWRCQRWCSLLHDADA